MARMWGNGHCHSFNGDGKMDLLARDEETGELFVFPHSGALRGTSTFLDPILIGKDFHPARNHCLIRSIDITGSGYASVLGLSMLPENENPGLFLYPNKGGLNGLATLGDGIRISGARDDKKWETFGIADISMDGTDDTFGREKGGGGVDAFFARREVAENNTFDRTEHRMVEVDVEDFPFAMCDVTGTGRPDLLVRRANGDLDMYEFAHNTSGEGYWWDGQGRWYTLARGWQQYSVFGVTDIDLDGKPDLYAKGADGRLLVFPHNGFDSERPELTYAESEVVATGWQRFDAIS